MIRHFTATGFVVHGDSTLLHWHHRVQAWLPPGGHVEPNEDPVQAVLREVQEETGLEVEIVPMSPENLQFETVEVIEAPRTILVEDVFDGQVGKHQHIDHIYFTRVGSASQVGPNGMPNVPDGWRWVTAEELQAGTRFENAYGTVVAPLDDVRKLGLAAIEAAAD